MCRPYSVLSAEFVKRMGLPTRKQQILTVLAHQSAPPVLSSDIATCELVIHWNGKRRTFFIEAMVWDSIPASQDMIISMQDALDTGLIAFALPHEWRRSWLGTAAFSNKLPLALRQDLSMAAAMHHELIMRQEDEDLIDISQRVSLTEAHIVTDLTSLSAAQRYWLGQFPNLNKHIPEDAHPDLPKFNPPFNSQQMEQYQDRVPSKTPRCSPKLQDKISAAFNKLSDARIIDLHANPVGVASYVVLVPKPNGELRICINFSKINKMLLRHHYPLPACADLISHIARYRFYAKLDLYNGFYNFDVDKHAQWLTSTIGPGHAFTWRKIPQGLAPVPNWFQWAMTTVLGDFVGTICLIYIDDLIILANSPEELNDNIRKILARLDSFNFRISIKKCDFEPTQQITFLGHHISHGSIRPAQDSSEILRAIVNPNDEHTPEQKASKLSTFLGLVNWFAKYIPDCSRQLLPLLNLKSSNWAWTDAEEACFQKFKDILCNLKPLHLPSGSNNRLEVHTDASKDGWFAVLFEDSGAGLPQDRLKVIAYAGGVFRKGQLAWSVLQKEMFAVYQAHLKFDHLIRLHEFRLVMDNKTMTYCETSNDMMVQRWYLRIQHYLSEIVHCPGSLNIVPDAGSRLLHLSHPNPETAQFQAIASAFCSMLSVDNNKRVKSYHPTPALLGKRVLDSALLELDDSTPDAAYACDDMSIRALQTQHANFCGCSGHTLSPTHSDPDDWATRPMPRGPNSASTVSLDHTLHGLNSTSTIPPQRSQPRNPLNDDLQGHSHHLAQWLQDLDDSASTHAQATNAVSVTTSALARLAAEPTLARRALPISPEHVHHIRTCHGGAAGHHGRDETIRKLQAAGLHWPTRFIDVARFIAACPHCQRFRLTQKHPYAMYKTILTNAPLFGRWHVDFMSISSPCSFTQARKILVMEDERSRFVMLHAVKEETAIEAVIAFMNTFAIFGIPESVRSDNAQNLVQAAAKEFVRITGIQHDFSIPHQAHSNGLVEHTCGDTSRLLRMLCADLHAYGRWSLLLPLVQRCLNSLTRSTLGCSANQLVFGNRVNLDRFVLPTAPMAHDDSTRAAAATSDTVQGFMDQLLVAQQDLLHRADQIRTKLLNDSSRHRPFLASEQVHVGQLVLVPWNDSNKKPSRFSANFMGPYVVINSLPTQGTVTLAHTIVPTPPSEPATYISAVSELRLYDDTLAIAEYDVPEDRFRQLAYIGRNARPIQSILFYRPSASQDTLPANHVNNFDYQVRFEDSTSLDDTEWLPYFAVQHTFAFEAFYHCARRELTGHNCISIPSEHRQVHQLRASAAASQRSRQRQHDRSVAELPQSSFHSYSPV
jgi:hypothetical protein